MGRVAVLEILEILKSLGTPSLPPSPAEAAAPSQLLHPKSDTGCSGNDFGSRRSSCCHPPLRGARQDLGAVDPHGTTALCQQLKEDGGGLGLIFRVEITESLRLTRPLGSSSSNIRKEEGRRSWRQHRNLAQVVGFGEGFLQTSNGFMELPGAL